ncbi:MAG: hypothetical protein A3A80_00680 [Candidatus Terrybacteria bacterium RIFCSPLOWO2_01_FULL_44_24]|uniref:Uncharacterized protein n=1 Tax=Candidatus Terrybacteria bacterium RIFCSPHIGHO2_01_FULL_43_35 TaxID=1802361 RepID=A0A1G2PCR3_9BACT|nr:MAG: hypothetical protein A2828_02685 [Candidatus Terrybacteria bacterium RIFCSPHIGHO2_01_FULL_43_35]OHA49506.1 MAG: hypothetical protein A3B75_00010 [Candidatus Terrybacteria bacterium RIFCSPHIGHO2_02_FULL_43_14]OHA51440.1 MAG: hypothetical protein A3A80_00680 [Candidatus Terrybacteria bacterium RIFCSPLOWO2_01_FULL_44_24]
MQDVKRRLIRWAVVVALILLIPLVLTIRDGGVEGVGWNWTFFDFIFMGTLLFGAGLVYELIARKMSNSAYRAAVGVAVVTAVLMVWINAAVGIIGDGDFPNAMYFGVLAIGGIGALIARFRPYGMSHALFAMALAQAMVPGIALIIWPPSVISWEPGVMKVFALNAVFVLLWVGSALLFRHVSATGSK